MIKLVTITLLLIITFAASKRLAPLLDFETSNIIEDHYIVIYHDDITTEQLLNQHFLAEKHYDIKHKYSTVVKGFSATLNEQQLEEVRSNDHVHFVEKDQTMYALDDTDTCVTVDSDSWGLDRISEIELKLDSFYSYPSGTNGGEGVTVYIIDTGIYVENQDFEGRAIQQGFKAESWWSWEDRNGHGSHVASTTGGIIYGVAKKVSLVAVKVLGDNGSGSNSGVIAGIEWAAAQNKGRNGVGNMSLGGGYSAASNAAVDGASASGLLLAVAAGNDGRDACLYSPASAKSAVTVGSTNSADGISTFSNIGSCVDILAPGQTIKAAWIGSPSATLTISGTSMASPHVAGVAALMRSADPNATVTDIKEELLGSATPNMIKFGSPCTGTCADTPNILLFNGCNHG